MNREIISQKKPEGQLKLLFFNSEIESPDLSSYFLDQSIFSYFF